MTDGVHDLPQYRRAGSPGTRLKRAKTVTVTKNSSATIRATRRIRYPTTVRSSLCDAEGVLRGERYPAPLGDVN